MIFAATRPFRFLPGLATTGVMCQGVAVPAHVRFDRTCASAERCILSSSTPFHTPQKSECVCVCSLRSGGRHSSRLSCPCRVWRGLRSCPAHPLPPHGARRSVRFARHRTRASRPIAALEWLHGVFRWFMAVPLVQSSRTGSFRGVPRHLGRTHSYERLVARAVTILPQVAALTGQVLTSLCAPTARALARNVAIWPRGFRDDAVVQAGEGAACTAAHVNMRTARRSRARRPCQTCSRCACARTFCGRGAACARDRGVDEEPTQAWPDPSHLAAAPHKASAADASGRPALAVSAMPGGATDTVSVATHGAASACHHRGAAPASEVRALTGETSHLGQRHLALAEHLGE